MALAVFERPNIRVSVPVQDRDAFLGSDIAEKMPVRGFVPSAKHNDRRAARDERGQHFTESLLIGFKIATNHDVAEITSRSKQVSEFCELFRVGGQPE